MAELTSFQKHYIEARTWFNLQVNPETDKRIYSTLTDIAPVDTTTISAKTLAVVALMLVHASKKRHYSPLNINTLASYDLNVPVDIEMFQPYVDYLLSKTKKISDASARAQNIATIRRYLFIAQQRGVNIIRE